MSLSPLEYGKQVCDAMMHRWEPEKLPPENTFFYHQGVFLSGMQKIYDLCGEEKYFQYVKDYVDSQIGPNGEIPGFDREYNQPGIPFLQWTALTKLDNRQPCVLLYPLYERTGEQKYRRAIETLVKSMHFYPVNSVGGYWHMLDQPYQMWLDGAYMAGPMCVLYDEKFGDPVLRERAIEQILIMDSHMKDEATGLYYHGWDESKKEGWADKKTGLSGQFWGRAVGWYAVAVIQILRHIDRAHPKAERLKRIEKELLEALAKYQDPETGLWFEVLDKPERRDNWVESSCTNLFIFSYAASFREGILEKTYEKVLLKAYQGIIDGLYYDEEGYLVIDKVCIGTCIESGTYEHYINREQIRNDLHGVGTFLLMCGEMEKYLNP